MPAETLMKKFTIEELAKVIGAAPAQNAKGLVAGVSIDSRTIKPGDCFFAVPGEKFDGHRFLKDAFAKGAACAVVQSDARHDRPADRSVLKVDDTVKALGDFAREYRRRMGFKVVAITGSAGKTTTRWITHHVLSRHFRAFQAPKSFNNNIGGIALPDIAVVTNVYPAHLAGFGSLQVIAEEKLSISEGLPPDGLLIINADFDSLVNLCAKKGLDYLSFGTAEASDIRAADIAHSGSGSSFTIDGASVCLPLLGPGNVENALAAWAVCSRFGLTADDFAQALRTLPPVPLRAELLQIGTLTVLNDCYNANPASMKNAIDMLANIDPAGKRRLVFVCGEMAELGQQSRHFHAELGALIGRSPVQLLLAVGDFAEVSAEAAQDAAGHRLQTECLDDAAALCNNLDKFIRRSDIVLVKGSRIAGLEVVVEKLKELFC
jgi:UDP-N-acetylmuramoyl-tripeptide--D-alanyl-D-alanine ligase